MVGAISWKVQHHIPWVKERSWGLDYSVQPPSCSSMGISAIDGYRVRERLSDLSIQLFDSVIAVPVLITLNRITRHSHSRSHSTRLDFALIDNSIYRFNQHYTFHSTNSFTITAIYTSNTTQRQRIWQWVLYLHMEENVQGLTRTDTGERTDTQTGFQAETRSSRGWRWATFYGYWQSWQLGCGKTCLLTVYVERRFPIVSSRWSHGT